MAAAGNVVGKVALVQGQVFARAKDGTQRPLKVGDPVFENEIIVTGENSRVELEFDNGKVFLLRAKETVTLDSAVIGSELPDNRNAALLDRVAELADITRAIAEGSSLDQLLEETAAGLTGGGSDGSHGFVQLLRIAEAVDPAGHNYQFNPGSAGYVPPQTGSLPDGIPLTPPTAPSPPPPAAATTTVTLSSPTAGAAITEGGSITYTASVGSPVSGADLVVTLSNGQAITIPVGQSSASIAVAVRADDAYLNGTDTLSVSISAVSGGNFEAVSTTGTVENTVVDDTDTTLVSIAGPVSIGEGGIASYTISLTEPAGTAVTAHLTYSGTASNGVDFSGSASITIPAGASSASLDIPIADDLLIEGPEHFTVTLASVSGGNFEGLSIDESAQSITTAIIDNDIAPVANAVTASGSEDPATPIAITLTGTDADGTVASFRLATLPANGTLYLDAAKTLAVVAGTDLPASGNALILYFQPNADWNGSTAFDFTAKDNTGLVSNSATATLNVAAVNDAPAGQADAYAATEGTTVIRGSILANDSDIDSPHSSLYAAQFAASPGGPALTANGSNSITTALGGTVTLRADGTFDYVAPARNHADATPDADSFVYRVSDGSAQSEWTTVTINIADSAPTAHPDSDSVGVGLRTPTLDNLATVTGNVITGAGGTGGQDELGADAARVSSIVFNGTTYALGPGNTTIVTPNGTLVINETGNYSYTSAYQNKAVAPSPGGTAATIADWNNAGIAMYGFDGTTPLANGGNTLTLSALTPAATGIVRYRNLSGSNNDGLGVETAAGNDNTTRIESNEHLVLDIGMPSRSASVTLTNLTASESAQWRAYDAGGALVASGTITGNASSIATGTLASATAFRYLVFSGSASANFRVNGLTATPDLSNLTPDQFTYTLTDIDGSSSTTTLTVSIDNAPVAAADAATVYESGLASGTQAGVLATVATGNLLANDAGISTSTTITSINGVTPSGGTITVSNAVGTLVVNATTGAYTYTLNGAATEGLNDNPVFNYVLTDSVTGQTTNANLTINIVDDAPIGGDIAHTLQAASGTLTYNLVLVVDRSGSMAMDADGRWSHQAGFDPNTVRMNIAKDALAKLIERFDMLGNVNVQIVDFASDVNESAWFVDNTHGAVAYIDGLQPGGGTQYSTALNAVMAGFTPPPADRTLFYFITDGQPNAGYEATGVQTAWQNFVAAQGSGANTSISFGIGIGSASLNALLPIAFPNVDADGNGQEDYAIKVANPTDLANTLLATVDGGVVVGNVSVLSGGGTSGFLMGADGGQLLSITVDGVTYTHAPSGPDSITITTNKGGELTVNFLTGEYNYRLVLNTTTQGQQETFQVTAIDSDGDTKTINMVIHLDYVANLDANRDIILTNVATGTPIEVSAAALLHNDAGSGAASLTGAQNPVNGSVTLGAGAVSFVPTGTPPTTIAVTGEAPYDSTTQPQNDIRQNAVDLTDRSLFGTVLPGTPAWNVDVAGFSRVFSGRIDNASGTRDYDYVKVRLYAGERLFVDIDNSTQAVGAQVEYRDGSGTLQTVSIANDGSGNANGWFTAPQDGDFYIRLWTTATASNDTDYNLVLTLDQATAAVAPAGGFDYTVTENGADSGASAVVYHVAGTTIKGGDGDEILIGGNTNDSLHGGAGNDVLIGGAGNDALYGGTGADRLEGGTGNDLLDGGAGNDLLIGGAGNDVLTGGLGADVFRWQLADRGTSGVPAVDTVTDFDATAGSDKLDLRDLLQGEIGSGAGANLEDYLHFEVSGGNTTVHVSSTGGFAGGYTPGAEDQTILLQGVDLIGGFTTDQQVIQDLLNKGKLITD